MTQEIDDGTRPLKRAFWTSVEACYVGRPHAVNEGDGQRLRALCEQVIEQDQFDVLPLTKLGLVHRLFEPRLATYGSLARAILQQMDAPDPTSGGTDEGYDKAPKVVTTTDLTDECSFLED